MAEAYTEKFAGIYVSTSMKAALVKYQLDNKYPSQTAAARAAFSLATKPVVPATPVDSWNLPQGLTPFKDLSRASFWTREVNGFLTEPGGVGPGGDPVLRNTLVDGFNSNPYPGSEGIERNDLRGPDVELNTTYWMTFYMRVNKMPDISNGGFFMLGPHEIHGRTLPQAPVQPQIGTAAWHPAGSVGAHIFEAEAGKDSHNFAHVGPVDIGNWHKWKFGIRYTQNNDGWAELYRDDKRVYRKDGPTTNEPYSGFWKFANYRSSSINGVSEYDVSGCRIYRA